jgi:hypothetical protein
MLLIEPVVISAGDGMIGWDGGQAVLQEAEERLRASISAGARLDLGDHVPVKQDGRWPAHQQIRAEAITAMLREQQTRSGTAALWVEGACIIGKLDLRYTRLEMPVILRHCRFDDAIELSEMRAASVSLAGSWFPSLHGYGMEIDEDLDCSECIGEQIDIFGAVVGGRLWLAGAGLDGSGQGYAVNAPDVSVRGGMYCRGLRARGVNLYGATIGSALELDEAQLTSHSGLALRARGLTVRGDLHCRSGFSATGTVDLFGAQIGGQLWLNAARLDKGDGDIALNAPQIAVTGGVYCNVGFTAHGGVNFFGATAGAAIEFSGARLSNPEGKCLRAPGLAVKTTLSLDGGFTSTGDIDLAGSRLGELSITDADLSNGLLDLRKAEIGLLHAAPASLPDRVRLNGLSYTALLPYLPAAERLNVLRRDQDGYIPQPYEQLAGCYRSLGDDERARTVLLAKQRCRRSQLRPAARAWGYLQDATVGYGYRPVRALIWLLSLVAIAAACFAAYPPPGARRPGHADFQPVIYAFHVVVPVLGVGQPDPYAGTTLAQWIIWAVQLAGWTLATAVVAGLTRVLSRN